MGRNGLGKRHPKDDTQLWSACRGGIGMSYGGACVHEHLVGHEQIRAQ
jgi:hypothetical protein